MQDDTVEPEGVSTSEPAPVPAEGDAAAGVAATGGAAAGSSAAGATPDEPPGGTPDDADAAADSGADSGGAGGALADAAAAAPAAEGRLAPPPWVSERWAALPRLAQVFIVLAALDILLRLLGFVQPELRLSAPLPALASLVSHDLVILFPAIVVLRRPDAPERTPWIVAGATVLAIVELVDTPLRFVIASLIAGGSVSVSLVGAIVATLLVVGGWVAIGWGLSQLNPDAPTPFVTGLANLVAVVILAAAVLDLLSVGLSPAGFATAAEDQLYAINQLLAAIAEPIAWAYVLRAVVRGFEDVTRPSAALRLGLAAASLAAVLALVMTLLGAILLVAKAPVVGFNAGAFRGMLESDGLVGLTWLGTAGATGLLILAFGLGLGEPFARFVIPEAGGSAILPE